MFYLIQLLNAVQYGLLLFLLSSGLTLIFGIMGVINLAHGSFYMIGAYLAYWLAKLTGSLWLAIPIGIAIAFGIGPIFPFPSQRRFPIRSIVCSSPPFASGSQACSIS